MPRHRPLFFTVKYCEKPFRDRHWYVSGFTGEKRVQLWFSSEKEAKAAVANRNAEIKAHGTQVALSPVDRIQAIAAAERLAHYGKSIAEAVSFCCDHLDRLTSSIAVSDLCARVGAEFERRLGAKEISPRHATSMRETLKKFAARFGDKHVELLSGNEIKAWLASEPLAVKKRNRHLSYIVEVDPITGKISEQDPDAYPKDYPERVEKFCRNYIWRKITGDVTVEFLEAAVDRMFSADEVTCVVDLERLKRLKHQIVGLFFTR